MESFSLITVIGLVLTIILYILKSIGDKRKEKEAEDAKIDGLNNADDIMRGSK